MATVGFFAYGSVISLSAPPLGFAGILIAELAYGPRDWDML